MDGSLAGVVDVRFVACAQCGDERAFEQPPCEDGHADGYADGHGECPDWACVECGFAIFLDPAAEGALRPVTSLPGSPDIRRHAA